MVVPTERCTISLEGVLKSVDIELIGNNVQGQFVFTTEDKQSVGRGTYRIEGNHATIDNVELCPPYRDKELVKKAMILLKRAYGVSEFRS